MIKLTDKELLTLTKLQEKIIALSKSLNYRRHLCKVKQELEILGKLMKFAQENTSNNKGRKQ